MASTKEPIWYYEHYPHYMGTMNTEHKLPDIATMDELHDAYKKDDESGYEMLSELDLPGYAWGDVLREWPAIRKSLEKKGEWAGEWEEGSHGLSMNSFKDARALVGKIEAEVFERCGEW